MSAYWRRDRLPELVRQLAGRPKHEALRGIVTELLREGFGARFHEIAHERFLVDNTGRIDVEWGAVVIELKSDLGRELRAVEAKMPIYLADAAASAPAGRAVVGIATDGATFLAYLPGGAAATCVARYETEVDRPERLLAWLEPLIAPEPDVVPNPTNVTLAFGRQSVAFGRARLALDALWSELGAHPEVRLKRDLWEGLLRQVYGDDVGSDALFLQHTYLTALVKAIAARVLDLPVDDAPALLSGALLEREGIVGAVEADFFDWPLLSPAGAGVVLAVAAETRRFRLPRRPDGCVEESVRKPDRP